MHRLTGIVQVRSTAPAIAAAMQAIGAARAACVALTLEALAADELEVQLAEVFRPVDQALTAIEEGV